MCPATPRRAFLHLVACTALAMSLALSEVWALGPHQARGARRLEITLDADRLQETIDILAAWFRRSRRRPRFSHRERRLILEHAERFRLSTAEVARSFLLSPATAFRWMKRRRSAWAGFPEPGPFKPTAPAAASVTTAARWSSPWHAPASTFPGAAWPRHATGPDLRPRL